MHEETGSLVVAELQAVVADLRHLVGFLGYISQHVGELETLEENRLALMAEAWAPVVAELAQEVEATLLST